MEALTNRETHANACTATWQSMYQGLARCDQDAGHYTSDFCQHSGPAEDGTRMCWRDGDTGFTPHRADTPRQPARTAEDDRPDMGCIAWTAAPVHEGGYAMTSQDNVRTTGTDNPDMEPRQLPAEQKQSMREIPEHTQIDAEATCCVCGGGPIAYDNYLGQLFCWRCADCDCGRDGPCIRTGLHRPQEWTCFGTCLDPFHGLARCERHHRAHPVDGRPGLWHEGTSLDGSRLYWKDGQPGVTPHRPDTVRTTGTDNSDTVPAPVRAPILGGRRDHVRTAIADAFDVPIGLIGDGRCSCGAAGELLAIDTAGLHWHQPAASTRLTELRDKIADLPEAFWTPDNLAALAVRVLGGNSDRHPAIYAWGNAFDRANNAEHRLTLARQVLAEDGYFTADQIGPDLAPRLVEWLAHHRSQIAELTRAFALALAERDRRCDCGAPNHADEENSLDDD